MGRPSKWLKPGWYVALCMGCDHFSTFPNKEIRDDWAIQHELVSKHYVDCIDGEGADED